jgi:hypothetical protein
MFSLEDLFCSVDDFCQHFEGQWKQQRLGSGLQIRNRQRRLSLSEIMTILIAFHQSCYRNFKTYYQEKVQLLKANGLSANQKNVAAIFEESKDIHTLKM